MLMLFVDWQEQEQQPSSGRGNAESSRQQQHGRWRLVG